MENHTGLNEKREMFGKRCYTRIGHSFTEGAANERKTELKKDWKSVRVEREKKGHYNIYGWGKK